MSAKSNAVLPPVVVDKIVEVSLIGMRAAVLPQVRRAASHLSAEQRQSMAGVADALLLVARPIVEATPGKADNHALAFALDVVAALRGT